MKDNFRESCDSVKRRSFQQCSLLCWTPRRRGTFPIREGLKPNWIRRIQQVLIWVKESPNVGRCCLIFCISRIALYISLLRSKERTVLTRVVRLSCRTASCRDSPAARDARGSARPAPPKLRPFPQVPSASKTLHVATDSLRAINQPMRNSER